MPDLPVIDPGSAIQFVVNAAAGSSDADALRDTIEAALHAGGRRGDLHFCHAGQLARVAKVQITTAPACMQRGLNGVT
ncbi:MAG: hypothetical protein KUA38_15560, partial [Hydrogenophaga sp.]|nr:hypothetical protein [Hydrogenophaga sp.]